MGTRKQYKRIRSMRERKLGAVIVFVFFVFLVFILWNWIETCYRRRQLFDLYFPATVQGLSVGANVTIDGRKIGQVESIRLRSLSPGPATQNYAVVTIYADMRKLWNLPGAIDDKAFRKAVEKQIEYGLRSRLRLPSLIAGGLCVELFYDRNKPAFFVDDPQCENIEIPTYSSSLSQYIDQINAKISEYKLRELSEKLLKAESNIQRLNTALAQIDFNSFNRKLISRTDELREVLNAETLDKKFNDLNAALERFATALKGENQNITPLAEAVSLNLRAFTQKIDELGKRFKISEELSPEILQKIEDTLHRYRNTLREYNNRLRSYAVPAEENQ